MKSRMKQRILLMTVAATMAATLTIPAMAAEQTTQDQVNQVQEQTAQDSSTSDITSFSDVSSTYWAYKDIMTLVNKGIIAGTSTPVNGVGTYSPKGTVTLGQFLAISTRLVANDLIKDQSATDVSWATPNYNAAVEAGLIGNHDFESTAGALASNITREDMAYILVNIATKNGETLSISSGAKESIGDFGSIAFNRQNAVLKAYSAGLLSGYDNGNFGPKDVLTRAQVAAVFCRVMNYTERKAPSFSTGSDSTTPSFNGYVSDEGDSKGMLIPKYSRQYDLEALQACRVGSDSNGVYVTFTAPQLPSEISGSFTYNFTSDVYKSNGNYFADKINISLKSGETKKVYFVSFQDTGVKASDISNMYVAVRIANKDNQELLMHSVDLTSKTKAVESWSTTGEDTAVDFNSSAIFSGIGK